VRQSRVYGEEGMWLAIIQAYEKDDILVIRTLRDLLNCDR
jgi:hypothetical protein